jgi:hypothetical protein
MHKEHVPRTRVPRTRSALGVRVRTRPDDVEGIQALRLQLKADKLADSIERTVRDWPPLTAAQLADLSAILADAPRAGDRCA